MYGRSLALALLFPVIVAAIVTAFLLPGQEPDNPDPRPPTVLPEGGVAARVGPITLSDIYLEGPQGLRAGATAPLRLALTNTAERRDVLLGVSSPVVAQAQLGDGTITVTRLPIPPGQTNLEHVTGVVFTNLRRSLQPGASIPVTFTFARAGTVTARVSVGPVGAS
jgi:hypothetical protein